MFLTFIGQPELTTAPLNVSLPGLHFKSDIEVLIVRQATMAAGGRGHLLLPLIWWHQLLLSVGNNFLWMTFSFCFNLQPPLLSDTH